MTGLQAANNTLTVTPHFRSMGISEALFTLKRSVTVELTHLAKPCMGVS